MLALRRGVILSLEPGIVLHSLPDQQSFYAFSAVTGDQYRLNRTSFWVLETISDGIEWFKLRNDFLSTFEVSRKEGEIDLRKLIIKFHRQGIIRRQDNAKEDSV